MVKLDTLYFPLCEGNENPVRLPMTLHEDAYAPRRRGGQGGGGLEELDPDDDGAAEADAEEYILSGSTAPLYSSPICMAVPMECLAPCPASLSEINLPHGSHGFPKVVANLLVSILKIVENDFFLRAAEARGRGQRGDQGGGAGRGSNGAAGQPQTLGDVPRDEADGEGCGFRAFLELVVGEDAVTVDGSYRDISLNDAMGVRLVVVCYGDERDLVRGYEKVFEMLASGRSKKRGGWAGAKANKDSTPAMLDYWNEIRDWDMFMLHAGTYAGENGPRDPRWTRSDGMPIPRSPLHPEEVFSRATSVKVLEAQGDGTRRVHPRQSSALIGIPALAWEIPAGACNRGAIMHCVLPRSARHPAANMTPGIQRDCLVAMRMMANLQSQQVQEMFRARFEVQEKRNDLKDVAKLFAIQMKSIRKARGRRRREDLLKAFRRRATVTLDRIFCETANISNPSKLISSWASRELETWTTPVDQRQLVHAEGLSSFGNMVALDFLHLETTVGVATLHVEFYMVLVCALNANFYELGELHCNVLLLGAGASGKSFILDSVTSLLIERTFNVVSNMTEKALATGQDNNDHITVFHEIPGRLLSSEGASRGANDTGDTLLKDVLTRGEVSTTSVTVTDTNQRLETTFNAEHCGVMLAATNEREDKMHESLKSRFICIPVNERLRPGAGVVEKQSGSMPITARGASEDKTAARATLERRIRVRQTMVHMVERLIYTKVIEKPDMAVAKLGFNRAAMYIAGELLHGEPVESRQVRFMVNFARTLTIMHACDRYANDAASPGFGKPVTFPNLIEVEPYLVCTEEIAVFVLSAFFDQITRRNAMRTVDIIMRAVASVIVRDPATGEPLFSDDDTYFFTQSVFRGKTRGRLFDTIVSAQKDSDVDTRLSRENIAVGFRQLMSMNASDGKHILRHDQDEGVLKINRRFVEDNFLPEPRAPAQPGDSMPLPRYRLRANRLDMLRDVIRFSFAHNNQLPTRNSIIAFPESKKHPFILRTVDIGVCRNNSNGVGRSTRPLVDNDLQHPIVEDAHIRVCEVHGGRVIVSNAAAKANADLQDLVYNERLARIRSGGGVLDARDEDDEDDEDRVSAHGQGRGDRGTQHTQDSQDERRRDDRDRGQGRGAEPLSHSRSEGDASSVASGGIESGGDDGLAMDSDGSAASDDGALLESALEERENEVEQGSDGSDTEAGSGAEDDADDELEVGEGGGRDAREPELLRHDDEFVSSREALGRVHPPLGVRTMISGRVGYSRGLKRAWKATHSTGPLKRHRRAR